MDRRQRMHRAEILKFGSLGEVVYSYFNDSLSLKAL